MDSVNFPLARSWVPAKVNEPEIPARAPVPVTDVDCARNLPVVRSTAPCTCAMNVEDPARGVKTIGPMKLNGPPTGEGCGVNVAMVVATGTPAKEISASVRIVPEPSSGSPLPVPVSRTGRQMVGPAVDVDVDGVLAVAGDDAATSDSTAPTMTSILVTARFDIAIPPLSPIPWRPKRYRTWA